jgi:hypothetical protein
MERKCAEAGVWDGLAKYSVDLDQEAASLDATSRVAITVRRHRQARAMTGIISPANPCGRWPSKVISLFPICLGGTHQYVKRAGFFPKMLKSFALGRLLRPRHQYNFTPT